MSKRDAWHKAFPLPHASKAVDALTEGWQDLSKQPKVHFNHETSEPNLTFVLADYVRNVMTYKHKLLGVWTCEDNKGNVDYATGAILKRIRTDIGFNWHDSKQNYSIVFEFKKLDRHDSSRKHYYGENGMERFVTGTYSKGDPLAFMAGILVDPRDECVKPLRRSLQLDHVASRLQMCKGDKDNYLHTPSLFHMKADFDTEHVRDREKAPKHGTIRIAHLFLSFGYASPKRESHKRRRQDDDGDA